MVNRSPFSTVLSLLLAGTYIYIYRYTRDFEIGFSSTGMPFVLDDDALPGEGCRRCPSPEQSKVGTDVAALVANLYSSFQY